jgi:hypothetical protein
LLLLAPSVWLARQNALSQPPQDAWFYTTLWHLGLSSLYSFAAMYLLAGYADYLTLNDEVAERYSNTHKLLYAITHRTAALAGVCLLTGGALVVGFLSGVGLTALALYGVVWAVLVGLVGGLPLNPVDKELSQLDPPE